MAEISSALACYFASFVELTEKPSALRPAAIPSDRLPNIVTLPMRSSRGLSRSIQLVGAVFIRSER